MYDSHYCAYTCSAIAICFVVVGSCLKISSSGGSSFKETSWAISARVFTWNVPVRLITMGMILMSAFKMPWVWSACLGGSYMS